MNILLIGQCTLHWGRMEFGNIGNYYIIEPFIREIHRVFPNAEVRTTFQMSDRFVRDEKVVVLPMDYYYGFVESDITTSIKEYEIAVEYSKTGELKEYTPYIKEVLAADLIIDFSGDIWGDNADFLGENRFLVGLYKNRVAQLLGKKTAMMAGSPGPFNNQANLLLAKEVFENFDLVTNRETFSREILKKQGFNLTNVFDLSCPAFLFEPIKNFKFNDIDSEVVKSKSLIGVVICGWNFTNGPFDLWPRSDKDYDFILEPLIDFLDIYLDVTLCLFSHSNGFIPGKTPFELIHGRDYPIIKQLEQNLINRGYKHRIISLNGVYDAWTTKGFIGCFDMLISGRVHAAVAGMSQYVPTVILDYGHEPKAHKIQGFANEAGMLEYVATPNSKANVFETINKCWINRSTIKTQLLNNIPMVKYKAQKNFDLLKTII